MSQRHGPPKPALQQESRITLTAPPGGVDAPGPRLLIVDDTAAVRASLRDFLRIMDLDVVGEAGDGEAAVEAVRALRPDIVLMDWRMPPGIDGLEATRRIAALGLDVRVIMLTAYAGPTAEDLCLRAGAVAMVAKGDHPTALVTAIERAWRARSGAPSRPRHRARHASTPG
jgi:DNA-binding NarL/FixJ family response regulator